MGKFDFKRFNGFARKRLDDKLYSDLWNHDIFNERDMHSSAYFYIRDYFRKHNRGAVYVRCESRLAGAQPDIVVYERGKPIYVLEFKFFSKPNSMDEGKVYDDLDKLAKCIKSYSSVRWGFFHMIYDGDDSFHISGPQLRRDGYSRISVTSINARRKEVTRRRRAGYDEWRMLFDKLQHLHRGYARARRRSNGA